MTSDIALEIDSHVAVLTLDRAAKLNAMTPEMTDDLRAHVAALNRDDTVRAVVLTGAGPKSFCAGSDIRELDTYPTAWSFRGRPDYCDAMRGLVKPSIAAINGYAFGGGLEMAMSCDIRIASPNARFAAPEIKLGWIGGGGMTALLSHSIGSSNAALMVMTGDPVSAEQAFAWGLVSEIVDQERLVDRARRIGETIAARAPIAAETAKLNLKAAFAMPLENAVQYERDLQTICFATEDAEEGRRAFKEKRSPNFQRR